MEIIELLKAHTYTSYLVGDCVNAMLLDQKVMDFDIACNASIDRIAAIFEDKFKTRDDLLYRGELIIINGAMGISVSPYRARFDNKGFPVYCSSIDEDLKRRAFTSEAVAYNVDTGIYDPFGGCDCITEDCTLLKAIDEKKYERIANQPPLRSKKNKVPEKVIIPSLKNNPECILDAMVKYSAGEAEISPFTLQNINENPQLLDKLDSALVMARFKKVLLGRRATDALNVFLGVTFRLFPILAEQLDYDQRSIYQEYSLFEHTTKAIGYAVPDFTVRLALLLHAVGKIDCAADRGEFTSYDGHAERAVMLARRLFEEMAVDELTEERVLFILRHHDDRINPENYAAYTAEYGAENIRLLLLAQSANIRAKSSDPLNERISATLRQLADGIVKTQQDRNVRGKTVTLAGLKSIADNLSRNGI